MRCTPKLLSLLLVFGFVQAFAGTKVVIKNGTIKVDGHELVAPWNLQDLQTWFNWGEREDKCNWTDSKHDYRIYYKADGKGFALYSPVAAPKTVTEISFELFKFYAGNNDLTIDGKTIPAKEAMEYVRKDLKSWAEVKGPASHVYRFEKKGLYLIANCNEKDEVTILQLGLIEGGRN